MNVQPVTRRVLGDMSFRDWWRLARAEHAFFVLFAVLIAEWFVGARDFAAALAIAVPPLLVTLGSFIFNDWMDYGSDRANRRFERPLVSGRVRRSDALIASFALFLGGVLFASLLSLPAFLIVLFFAVLAALYSLVLKKLPLVGNLYVAASMAISFLYGNYAVTPVLAPLLALWAGVAFLTGVGRELLITLRDVKGDRAGGATTLPMLIGASNTVRASSALFLGAALLSILPLQQMFSLPYLALVLVADALLALTLLAARDPTVENLKAARNYSLAALAAGLLAFASLAL